LKEGAYERIEQLKIEYNNIDEELRYLTGDAKKALETRKRNLKTICDCAKALEDIDRDLETFCGHLQGEDAKLKEIAEGFTKEFLLCKEQLESQLNKLL
jgi:protein subunit release factor A